MEKAIGLLEKALGLLERASRKRYNCWKECGECIGIAGESVEIELGLLEKAWRKSWNS